MATFRRGHSSRRVHTGNARMIVKFATPPAREYSEPRRELSEAMTRDLIVMHLISRDGDYCYICTRSFAHCDYALEHIIPQSRGGPDTYSNYALACRSCNSRKGNRFISIAIKGRYPCFWYST